jgi:hypothetical protein
MALLDSAAAPSDPAVLRYLRLQQTLALPQLRRRAETRTILDELDAWGRFHWRLRLSCARGLCC